MGKSLFNQPLLGAEEVPARPHCLLLSGDEALRRVFKLPFLAPDNITFSNEVLFNIEGPSQ